MKSYCTLFLIILSSSLYAQTNSLKDTTTVLGSKPRAKILMASKDGGELDFWTKIKGHEYDGYLIEKGAIKSQDIYATNREIAIIKWAMYLTKFGVRKDDIISIYQELKQRKTTVTEIELIDMGIKKANNLLR